MTVNILIQIDKLVQLLESPVFTCTSSAHLHDTLLTSSRPPSPTTRAGQVSPPLQMPLWLAYAPASIICFCCAQEPAQQCQLHWVSAHRTKTVCGTERPSITLSTRVCGGGSSFSSDSFSSSFFQVRLFKHPRYSHNGPLQFRHNPERPVIRPAEPTQGSGGGYHTMGGAPRKVQKRPGASQAGTATGRQHGRWADVGARRFTHVRWDGHACCKATRTARAAEGSCRAGATSPEEVKWSR